MGAFQTQMEVTSQKFQELQNKAMDGKLDEESQKQMEALAKQMMEQSLQGAGMMGTVFKAMLPALGISFILSMLIAMLAKSYFVVIAVKGLSDPVNAVQTAIAWLVPLIGLWAWLFLRSFVWIPIAGLVIAIVVGPRFLLSPLYLLEQKKGVMESVRLSYAKTNGYWGKIFGNALLVGIVTMICSGILAKIAMSVLGSMLGAFVAAVIGEFAAAFLVVFSMQLARTVMQGAKA